MTIVFCVVNVAVRFAWTEKEEEKAATKACVICTFACTVFVWWLVDWCLILTNSVGPANGEGYAEVFNQ